MKNKTEQLVPKQLKLKGRKHALVTMPPDNLQFNALESFMSYCKKQRKFINIRDRQKLPLGLFMLP